MVFWFGESASSGEAGEPPPSWQEDSERALGLFLCQIPVLVDILVQIIEFDPFIIHIRTDELPVFPDYGLPEGAFVEFPI